MKLYHKDIFFPEFTLPESIKLKVSLHAQQARITDRYKSFEYPKELWLKNCEVFEIGIQNDKVVKLACRMPYDASFDLSLVINTQKKLIVTGWLNKKGDHHQTLNKRLYQRR